jgi:hypothetical protein
MPGTDIAMSISLFGMLIHLIMTGVGGKSGWRIYQNIPSVLIVKKLES